MLGIENFSTRNPMRRSPEPMQTETKVITDIYQQKNTREVGGKVIDIWRIQLSFGTTFVGAVSNPSWQFTNIAVPFDLAKLTYVRYFLSAVTGAPLVLPFQSYFMLTTTPAMVERAPNPTIGGATPAGTALDTNGFPPCIVARSLYNFGESEESLDYRIRGRNIGNLQLNWIGDGAVAIAPGGIGSLFNIGYIVSGYMDLRFEAIKP